MMLSIFLCTSCSADETRRPIMDEAERREMEHNDPMPPDPVPPAQPVPPLVPRDTRGTFNVQGWLFMMPPPLIAMVPEVGQGQLRYRRRARSVSYSEDDNDNCPKAALITCFVGCVTCIGCGTACCCL